MGSPSYKYDIAPTTKRGEMTREGTAALISDVIKKLEEVSRLASEVQNAEKEYYALVGASSGKTDNRPDDGLDALKGLLQSYKRDTDIKKKKTALESARRKLNNAKKELKALPIEYLDKSLLAQVKGVLSGYGINIDDAEQEI